MHPSPSSLLVFLFVVEFEVSVPYTVAGCECVWRSSVLFCFIFSFFVFPGDAFGFPKNDGGKEGTLQEVACVAIATTTAVLERVWVSGARVRSFLPIVGRSEVSEAALCF